MMIIILLLHSTHTDVVELLSGSSVCMKQGGIEPDLGSRT